MTSLNPHGEDRTHLLAEIARLQARLAARFQRSGRIDQEVLKISRELDAVVVAYQRVMDRAS
jgi:hypothetical protein